MYAADSICVRNSTVALTTVSYYTYGTYLDKSADLVELT